MLFVLLVKLLTAKNIQNHIVGNEVTLWVNKIASPTNPFEFNHYSFLLSCDMKYKETEYQS